jgi:transaldolase
VFLDRDGVLNRAIVREGRPYPPATLEELEVLPEVPAALARLRAAGFLLVVVTNQPDVARGEQRREVVDATHARLLAELPLDAIEVCFEDGDDAPRRKPNPGMLLDAARRLGIDLPRSFLVGDRWRDVEAGRRAGCTTLFVDRGYAESLRSAPDHTVADLAEAADRILSLEESTVTRIEELKVKIFADGADKKGMLELGKNPAIKGFTTNPSLMKQAGVKDYEAFCREIVAAIPDRPLSFEVFSDDLEDMARQAAKIMTWGKNVYVKIPVMNTERKSCVPLVKRLSAQGVKLNVTALMTLGQVRDVGAALEGGAPAYVSVFAGRIADTGRDPVPLMAAAVELLRPMPNAELLWASPRELLNIFQADAIGCHVITVSHDVLKKLDTVGKDLDLFSLETVKTFRKDALAAGFTL